MRWMLFLCIAFSFAAQAKTELTILVGLDKPPYIDLNDSSGYELDLLRLLTKKMGYEAIFLHVPNARIKDLMLDGRADIATLQKPEQTQQQLYFSKPYIRYQNVAASLESKSLQLQRLDQLQPYAVVAFHNARTLLGPEYQKIARLALSYQEVANQSQQLQMLVLERCDVVVMDRNIFLHYYRQTAPNDDSLKILNFFQVNHYHMLARTPEVAERFNQALAEVKQSELFSQLQLQYFAELNQ